MVYRLEVVRNIGLSRGIGRASVDTVYLLGIGKDLINVCVGFNRFKKGVFMSLNLF